MGPLYQQRELNLCRLTEGTRCFLDASNSDSVQTFFCPKSFKPWERQADPKLLQKLQAERAGILRWLVEGCLLWQKHGLKIPESLTAGKNKYREENFKINPKSFNPCQKNEFFNPFIF